MKKLLALATSCVLCASASAACYTVLGKDGKTYGRLTKVGMLSAGMEGGEATLTCTVNTEGSEG